MRYIGIDYGSKKIGLALSDESGNMAFPHAVWPNDDAFFGKLEALVSEREVGSIVIGHSKNKDGSDNDLQTAITALVTDLTLATGLPVHLEPEQYSTQAATRIQGKNEHTDASAAALILDSFFIKQRNAA